MKRRLKNRLPWTKFPLYANIYKLVSGKVLKFLASDKLRPDALDGKLYYIFKSNADVILAPPYGSEDAGNTIDLLQTEEGGYVLLKRTPVFTNKDGEIEELTGLQFEISLDEQAKFLFANQLELQYSRFDKERGFFEKYGATIVLTFALAVAGVIILVGSTSNLTGLTQATNALASAMNQQNQVLGALTNAVQGGTPP